MKVSEFIEKLDDAQIVAAIAAAEQRTSGEIRVFISAKVVDDPLAHATRRFERLGMTQTRERNGVLLYFAPRARQFAICGDSGIHEKCGPAFWEELLAKTREKLRTGDFTAALVQAIGRIGGLLGEHFPMGADDRDELSNEIIRE